MGQLGKDQPVQAFFFKGIYVFAQWVYRHPYAVQTCCLEDWRGFLQALQLPGYTLRILKTVRKAAQA